MILQRPKYSDAMITLAIQLSIGIYKFTVNTRFCFPWLCFILISFFIFSVWYFCYIDNHIAHKNGGHKSLGTRTVLGKQSWMWWCGEKILSKVVWKGKTIFFVCFKTLLTKRFWISLPWTYNISDLYYWRDCVKYHHISLWSLSNGT